MSADRAFERLREANPVPVPAVLREVTPDPGVFIASTRRWSEAKPADQEAVRSLKAPRPARRRWITALAALAVVAAVGVAVVISGQGQRPDLATTPAARLAVAEAFMEAFFSWDAGALEAAVGSAELPGFSEVDQTLDDLLVAQAELAALNFELGELSCVEANLRVECGYTGETDVTRLLGQTNHEAYSLLFSDGELTRVSYSAVPEPIFYGWVDWLFDGNGPQSLETCRYGPADPDPGVCAAAQVQSALDYLETETHRGVSEGFRAVEAAYSAYNSGDGRAWWEARDAGSFYAKPDDRHLARETFLELYAAARAAGARIEVARCHFDDAGVGNWPTLVDDGIDAPSGYHFTCEVSHTNAFHAAGGVSLSMEDEWVTADEGIIAVKSAEEYRRWQLFQDWSDFGSDFSAWMAKNQPGVVFDLVPGEFYGFPSEASVPTALEYVNEFVEDSPDWPRSSTP